MTKILLYSKSASNMTSIWRDYLYCTYAEGGFTFELGMIENGSQEIMLSEPMDVIKSPSQFVTTFFSHEVLSDWNITEVIASLNKVDPVFAFCTHQYYEYYYAEELNFDVSEEWFLIVLAHIRSAVYTGDVTSTDFVEFLKSTLDRLLRNYSIGLETLAIRCRDGKFSMSPVRECLKLDVDYQNFMRNKKVNLCVDKADWKRVPVSAKNSGLKNASSRNKIRSYIEDYIAMHDGNYPVGSHLIDELEVHFHHI